MVDPVEQQELPLELVLARRDDLVQVVPLAELLELGVVVRVEVVTFGIVVLHVGECVELRQHRLVAVVEIHRFAFAEQTTGPFRLRGGAGRDPAKAVRPAAAAAGARRTVQGFSY